MFTLPCGLGVYRSKISAPNDELSVLGGPHHAWADAGERSNNLGPRSFLTAEARAYFVQASAMKHVYNQPCCITEESEDENTVEESTVEHVFPQSVSTCIVLSTEMMPVGSHQ